MNSRKLALEELRRRVDEFVASGPPGDQAPKDTQALLEELNVYYQELEFQNDELSRIRQDLEQSRLHYKDLYDNAPFGYVTYDRDRAVVSANKRFAELLDAEPDDLVGRSLTRFVAPESQDALHFHLRDAGRGGRREKVRLSLRGAAGDVPVLFESDAYREGERSLFRSAVVDLRQEAALEAALESARHTLEATNAELQDYHDRLEATMLSGNIAWWRLDLRTGGVLFNGQKARMIGRDPKEFSHYEHFTALVHPDDYEPMMQAMRDFVAGRTDAYRTVYRIAKADGEYAWFQDIGVATERGGDGRPLALTGVVIDISEQKRAETAALKASKAKSEFLANMSHEIRTPLNAIIGFTDLLKDAELGPTQREYLENANESAHMLLDIVNDVLDFSKIEAGKLELEELPTDLEPLLARLMAIFEPGARKKGLALRLELPERLPGRPRVDPGRLRQVLVNLVGNAVKFTYAGEVALRLDFSPTGEGEGAFTFSVSDTGIGISKEQAQGLFTAFTQADATVTRRYGGTGLGLAISTSLVAAMGAKLSLASEPGRGSVFSFSLIRSYEPRAGAAADADPGVDGGEPAERAEPAAELARAYALSDSAHTILVAEDVRLNMDLAEAYIRRYLPAAAVLRAKDGLEATELARRERPDLIFMDVQMPGMDGYSAAEAIRRIESGRGDGRRVPIVALSAGIMKEERERCLAAGMDDFLAKPMAPEALRAALAAYLGLNASANRPGDEPGASAGGPADRPVPLAVFNSDALLATIDGDRELMAQMLSMGVEHIRDTVAEIGAKAGDEAELRRLTHRLRGAMLTLCCARLAEKAAALEKGGRPSRAELDGLRAEAELASGALAAALARLVN